VGDPGSSGQHRVHLVLRARHATIANGPNLILTHALDTLTPGTLEAACIASPLPSSFGPRVSLTVITAQRAPRPPEA
jgi:hypothetical protein